MAFEQREVLLNNIDRSIAAQSSNFRTWNKCERARGKKCLKLSVTKTCTCLILINSHSKKNHPSIKTMIKID